jgi:preprotein translocase subunit SecA
VEGANFDLRKHLLEYDDVLNKQRGAVYKRRRELLAMLDKEALAVAISDAALSHFDAIFGGAFIENPAATRTEITKALKEAAILKGDEVVSAGGEKKDIEHYRKLIEEKSAVIAEHPFAKNQLLGILDMLWMTNLEDLEALSESVGLRAYAQRDPLVEYRHEASRLFKTFCGNFNAWVFNNLFKLATVPAGNTVGGGSGNGGAAMQIPKSVNTAPGGAVSGGEKVGRNDQCPCGSGKKYKRCGLLNTEEHQRFTLAKSGPKHEVTGG